MYSFDYLQMRMVVGCLAAILAHRCAAIPLPQDNAFGMSSNSHTIDSNQ